LGTPHEWLHEKNCATGIETASSRIGESEYATKFPGKKRGGPLPQVAQVIARHRQT